MTYDKTIVAFRHYNNGNVLVVKYSNIQAKYAVLIGKDQIYTSTPFLVQAMSTLNLLMAESGIGATWHCVTEEV